MKLEEPEATGGHATAARRTVRKEGLARPRFAMFLLGVATFLGGARAARASAAPAPPKKVATPSKNIAKRSRARPSHRTVRRAAVACPPVDWGSSSFIVGRQRIGEPSPAAGRAPKLQRECRPGGAGRACTLSFGIHQADRGHRTLTRPASAGERSPASTRRLLTPCQAPDRLAVPVGLRSPPRGCAPCGSSRS